MLTDTALKQLKTKEKDFKIADRDGMYVVVKKTGAVVFRLDYRLHGRRETLTIGCSPSAPMRQMRGIEQRRVLVSS